MEPNNDSFGSRSVLADLVRAIWDSSLYSAACISGLCLSASAGIPTYIISFTSGSSFLSDNVFSRLPGTCPVSVARLFSISSILILMAGIAALV